LTSYDPISDRTTPTHHNVPESFWANDVKEGMHLYPPLPASSLASANSVETDVAIIGGGFTGLSTALHLQKHFGMNCTVIEANQPGWGASGRNGGFVLPGTGRLGVQQLEQKWGKAAAQAIYIDYLNSVNNVKDIVASFLKEGIDCDYSQGGYLKLAHKAALVEGLHAQASLLSNDFGDSIIPLSREQISDKYLAGAHAYGGIYYPNAFSVNPWKLCQGIAHLASRHGTEIVGNTAFISSEYKAGKHHIQTSSGAITAKALVLATNAYGLRKLHPLLTDRMFPVMSSILVTQPLTNKQLSALGMHKGLMVMDTRSLKYYYRLLPNNRLLFGGRGAVKGKNANDGLSQQKLFTALQGTFPSLHGLAIDKFWSGWVSVSFDDYPRIHHDKSSNTFYSGGYCGAGLAFSIQAGKRIAQLMCAPDELPDLPYWETPLKRFPFANLRRPALSAFYAWEGFWRR
jgi:glycine/D-amino acid oxidase-like deaminating enzyme